MQVREELCVVVQVTKRGPGSRSTCVICFRRMAMDGASGSDRKRLRRARLTATCAEPSHGN